MKAVAGTVIMGKIEETPRKARLMGLALGSSESSTCEGIPKVHQLVLNM